MTNGIWLLPTRARPAQALKLLEQCEGMNVILLVNEKDPSILDYVSISKAMFTCESEGMAAKCQEFFAAYPTYDWYGVLTDDLEPQTEGWAAKLIAQTTGWNIIASNDGWQQRMQGALVFSGDLLRAVGYFAPPGLKHLYFDNVWEELGKATGCLQYDMNVVVNHAHANRTGATDETHRKVSTFWATDERAFAQWRITDRDGAIDRVTQLMREKGLTVDTIDLSHIKLLISTPCGSGRYSDCYVESLLQTILALRKWGAHVDWVRQKNSSDLPLARAMIFGKFYRSPFTHMLKIDDDMGWEPIDIARMLMLDREFIAAAGPRKAIDNVQKFAFSNADDWGNSIPILQEATTGLISGDGMNVGAAFVLINQACARRMVEAYEQLGFDASDGKPYWHLYLPFVLNRVPYGEDFAFCYRWRAIGGRVNILPDVRLKHAGGHVWEGAASDYVNFENAQGREEAAE